VEVVGGAYADSLWEQPMKGGRLELARHSLVSGWRLEPLQRPIGRCSIVAAHSTGGSTCQLGKPVRIS
jgi:hypothetical protein